MWARFGRDFGGKVVYFGAGPCADPQITDIRESGIQEAACLQIDVLSQGQRATINLPLLGRHNASNAVAAIAVAREAGVPLRDAIRALETLTAGDKRGEILALTGKWAGATIINDSYNSNPEALKSMIQALAARPAKRRILVAGEMLELGNHATELHEACGRAAAEAGIDVILGRCAAMPSTSCWARAAQVSLVWTRSFCPMRKPPAVGLQKISGRGMWRS